MTSGRTVILGLDEAHVLSARVYAYLGIREYIGIREGPTVNTTQPKKNQTRRNPPPQVRTRSTRRGFCVGTENNVQVFVIFRYRLQCTDCTPSAPSYFTDRVASPIRFDSVSDTDRRSGTV